jgi:hypothetical protein
MKAPVLAVYLTLCLAACVAQTPNEPPPDVDQANIERVLGRPVSEAEAVGAIDQIFAAEEPGGSAYCCGPTRCECTDLGDCINLWFASVCADIPGPDIVNGECVNNGSCTNEDCSCPD